MTTQAAQLSPDTVLREYRNWMRRNKQVRPTVQQMAEYFGLTHHEPLRRALEKLVERGDMIHTPGKQRPYTPTLM